MHKLDELLELLWGARERWKTVRATLRYWEDTARRREAWDRLSTQGPPGSLVQFGPMVNHESRPRFEVAVRRVWARKPYRWRLEFESSDGTNIFVGDLAWPETPEAPRTDCVTLPGALSLETIDGTVAYTFDPWILVPELEMRVLGRAKHTGREAVRVSAVAEAGQSTILGAGADDYELLVDAKWGVLLRSASRLDGEEFEVTEILDIAFDEDLPEELFDAEDVFVAEPPQSE